jgi:hypothetical protein
LKKSSSNTKNLLKRYALQDETVQDQIWGMLRVLDKCPRWKYVLGIHFSYIRAVKELDENDEYELIIEAIVKSRYK